MAAPRPLAVALLVAAAASSVLPQPARADDLDTILSVLAQAGLIDKDVVAAKPVFACLIAKGSADPGAVLACVEQHVKESGAAHAEEMKNELLQSDSKIVLTFRIADAATDEEWWTVLELAGVELLPQLGCTLGLAATGPVGSFVCGEPFQIVRQRVGDPVLKASVEAVRDQRYWDLVTLLGPTLVCDVISLPSDLAGVVCGPLAELVEAVGDAVESGIDLGEALAAPFVVLGESVYTAWKNDVEKMAPDKYFKIYWVNFIHAGALEYVVNGPGAFDAYVGKLFANCADHYDSTEPCGPMRDEYVSHVAPMGAALAEAHEVYFEAEVRPDLLHYYRQHLTSGASSPDINLLAGTSGCVAWMYARYPLPTAENLSGWNSVWAAVCSRARAALNQALAGGKTALETALARLVSAGCAHTPSAAKLTCTTFEAFETCRRTVQAVAAKNGLCGLDPNAANKHLAEKTVAALGSKRCHTSSGFGAGVICTRPWKAERCPELVDRYGPEPPWKATVDCTYQEEESFVAEALMAAQLTLQLDAMPAHECRQLWDPVTLSCDGEKLLPDLEGISFQGSWGLCPADPNRDGQDLVCYVPEWRISFADQEALDPNEHALADPSNVVPPDVLQAGQPIEDPIADRIAGCLAEDKRGVVTERTIRECADARGAGAGALVTRHGTLRRRTQILVDAARDNWRAVLENGGVDAARRLACASEGDGDEAARLLCTIAGEATFEGDAPLLASVLEAVQRQSWEELLTLAGPERGCGLIPSDWSRRGAVCGVLDDVLKGRGTGGRHDAFYMERLRPWLHTRVLERLTQGRSFLGLDAGGMTECIDALGAAGAEAPSICRRLSARLHAEAEAFGSVLQAAPRAYFSARVQPRVLELVADDFFGTATEDLASSARGFDPRRFQPESLLLSGSEAVGSMYRRCVQDMRTMYSVESTPRGTPTVPTMWDQVCGEVVGRLLTSALQAAKSRVTVSVKAKLGSVGCRVAQVPGSNRGVFECDGIDAFGACQDEFKGQTDAWCRMAEARNDGEG